MGVYATLSSAMRSEALRDRMAALVRAARGALK